LFNKEFEQEKALYQQYIERYYEYEKKDTGKVTDINTGFDIKFGKHTISSYYHLLKKHKDGTIEGVIYKVKKPVLTTKARTEANHPRNDIVLAFLHHNLRKKWPDANIIVSYYHLKNKKDEVPNGLVKNFNEKENQNIVSYSFKDDEAKSVLSRFIKEIDFKKLASENIKTSSFNFNCDQCRYCDQKYVCRKDIVNGIGENKNDSVAISKVFKPNKEQREATKYINGPLRIIAPAGSGKTATIVHRYAYMLKNGISPEQILMLSFSRKAVFELKERVSSLVPDIKKNRLNIYTIHSFAKVLSPEFKFIDKAYVCRLIIDYIENNDVSEFNFTSPLSQFGILERIYKFVSAKLDNIDAPSTKNGNFNLLCDEVYMFIRKKMKQENYVTFNEMIEICAKKMNSDKYSKKISLKYRYLVVDEFQDVDHNQFSIMNSVGKWHKNFCIVGDDDQSIYQFRKADSTLMINFVHQYPDTKDVRLLTNYRSANTIIDFANEFIRDNSIRIDKQVQGVGQKGTVKIFKGSDCVSYMQKLGSKFNYCDIQVIARTHKTLEIIQDSLLKAGIPAYQSVVSLIDTFEFHVLLNSLKYLLKQDYDELYLKKEFLETDLSYIESDSESDFAEDIQTILKITKSPDFIHDYVLQKMEQGVTTLVELIAKVSDTKLFNEYVPVHQKKNGVGLITAHSAKGKEYPIVVIPFLDEFYDSSNFDIEEQRNLLYVAMSRPSKHLILNFNQSNMFTDKLERILVES
jgi:superfamily I DNA/RNA helicase